jgi:hypothetical protein
MADPVDRAEPIDRMDPTEPTLPTEATEPMQPMDSSDPRDPIDSTELADHSDRREEPADVMSASSTKQRRDPFRLKPVSEKTNPLATELSGRNKSSGDVPALCLPPTREGGGGHVTSDIPKPFAA